MARSSRPKLFFPQDPPQPKGSLSAIAIRRHIGTLMLTLATMVLGVFFLLQLNVDLLPAITYPRIGLRVDAPGVSPEVALEEVTKPLEAALSATEGVVQVYSQTREGRISLDLFFQPGEDIDQALNDATATLNRARSSLPDIVEEPRLFKFDPSQLPVYEFALESSLLDPVQLRVFADQEIARELAMVLGVASVDVSGGLREEVQVNLDLNRLQSLGVSLQDVLTALRERNQDIAGGRLEGDRGEPLARTIGRLTSIQELRDLPLPLNSSRRIYLRDVAEVVDGAEDQRVFVSLNGEGAVKVSIQKQADANTIAVVDAVKTKIAEMRDGGAIPPDMTLVPTLDESRFIRSSIENVVTSGVTGTILAALAVFFFLGSLRQTFIIVTAIPLATLAAVILMQLFGLSINVFSLGGLALGVGIVVDNSIVMLEAIAAGSENHDDPITHAIAKGQEVESALIASTMTNLVSVLPFLMMGGLFSLLFRELILTISFAVAASLILALTVVPALASRLLGLRNKSGVEHWGMIVQFNRSFLWVRYRYGQLLAQALKHRLWVIILAFALFGSGSGWMAGQLPQNILPGISTGQANLWAQFPPGTTLAENRQVMARVDELLLAQPETEYVFTTAGGALFANQTSANILRGSSSITLKPGTNVEAYVERVTRELDRLNLVNTRLRLSPGEVRGIVLSNSPIRGADVDITIQGDDGAVLAATGQEILRVLDENVDVVRFRPDADPPEAEVQVLPDWQRLATYDLTNGDVGETVQTALQGSVPTRLQRRDMPTAGLRHRSGTSERLVDIRVQLPPAQRQGREQLAQVPLFTSGNTAIRLRDVIRLEPGLAPSQIQRINQRGVFMIAGNLVEEGGSVSEAIAQTEAALATVELPPGVVLIPSSQAEGQRELQAALKLLGALAVFLVFVVMAVQYNSLIDPLVILCTIPLALAGGILGLYVTQTEVGAMVLVGAVLLVGIVVNNAIVLVELANQIREEFGISRYSAMLRAAPQRLRPILMTTITTVLGLFPLALGIGEGSEFLQPLGVVVFSGLSLATLLTLFIIPCFYVLFSGGNPLRAPWQDQETMEIN
ncbi:efflux RND transporter permease subunit [Spirulina sp. CCNP1310]|uniref:efflux RND transporter permease subunit n=1 Tax=Spirulina sp. CCNP1310 TaxID=3110249 RepID=UPI002B201418|nr:efflux RND transporter permease subunit [Spirulina sp. CCNP1310]MEA5418066.1 efflux RND transporter permease subunit [Spirulina sp. CCNP1310]